MDKRTSTELLNIPRNVDRSKHIEELLNISKKQTKRPTKDLISRPDIKRLPESSALSRVRSFLPQIHNANKTLEAKISDGHSEDVCIENTEDCEKVIEMDLALTPNDIDKNILKLLGSNFESDSESSDDEELAGEDVSINGQLIPSKPFEEKKNLIQEMVKE